MDYLIESLSADWESFLRFAPKLFYAGIVLIIALFIARLAGHSTVRVLERSARLRANKEFLRHVITWLIGSAGILLALGIMGFKGIAASLLATGGVAAIVLGFAFREIGENFLAGFFLTFSRPFELEDLIKTGELTGNVKSIELRYVHIRTFDACDVFVPSAQIFREPLHNFTRDGMRRPSFTVGVAYHDDPDAVIGLLNNAVREVADVLETPEAFITINEFASQYVEYEVFFWLDVNNNPRGFVATNNDVRISCWRALRDAGMTFSTDVSTGIDIQSVPPLEIANPGPGGGIQQG